jgi:hypothetical protein
MQEPVQIVQIVQPLRSVHHWDQSVPVVPIVQPLRSVQIVSEKTAKTLIRDESAGHGFYLAG